jgi:hypothetical protein
MLVLFLLSSILVVFLWRYGLDIWVLLNPSLPRDGTHIDALK